MTDIGEKIGTFYSNDEANSLNRTSARDFLIVRHLQDSIIRAVFAGAGCTEFNKAVKDNDNVTTGIEIYTNPPTESKSEAYRLGYLIQDQFERAIREFPGVVAMNDAQTFVPAAAELQ